jgi:DNA-binding response OmpR family regulator
LVSSVSSVSFVPSITPIILLTGLSLQADELLRVTQANACFFKPVDFPELCKTAQELLRESRPN